MVTELLVGPKISDGRKLLRRLDRAGLQIQAAFWNREEETDRWKLVLATPLVGKLGLVEVIDRIIAAATPALKDSLLVFDVTVTDMKDRRVRALMESYKTGPGIHGIGMTDAYLYRVM